MEACLLSPSSSSKNISDNHDSRGYGLLPVFSTTASLRSEIPERLLQDDASALSPSYNGQNALTRHNSLQESDYSSREEPRLQQDPSRQDQIALPRHPGTQDQPEHVSDSSTTLFQEWNHAEADRDVRKASPKPYSWKEKLGTFAIISLTAGSVLLFAVVGTLAFMWFGSPAIPAWKEMTARNWLSKAISICIGVIQQIMMLQLGIVAATLASLALESGNVSIGDVASVSAMRATATSTGAFVMAWQYLSGGSYRSARHSCHIFPIFSAAILWCLSQFLLLIILTDVSLQSTAGLASPASLPYSLHYNVIDPNVTNSNVTSSNASDSIDITWFLSRYQDPSMGAWYRKISKYALFAEYSEPPYEADGVSDTGVTLRAFLPFGTAQDRERLESYKGKSTVLDARVTCQVPQIKNATIDPDGIFRGSLTATRNTPRLANLTLPDGSRNFNCVLTPEISEIKGFPQWGLSLCQLWYGMGSRSKGFGGLHSEFRNSSLLEPYSEGSAYLLLNTTFVTISDIAGIMGRPGLLVVTEASRERREWLDLFYLNGSATISASICYTAFDFADIDVSISSQSNRTESRLEPAFDQDTSTYTFQELRYAMGQDRSLPIHKRGVLELEKGTWQVAPHGEYSKSQYYSMSDLRRTTDLGFTKSSVTMQDLDTESPFMTGLFGGSPFSLQNDACACVTPEDMHISLVQEILQTNGSIAFALQTMITLLSSMAYYDQMGQFDKWTQAELTFFETAQVPVGYVGFVVVMIIVAAHCILVVYCVSLFIRRTTLSRLGASWSTVAQVATGDVKEYLEHATLASDNDVQARLRADGQESSKVCLEEIDGQVSVSIIGKDEEN